MIGNKSIAVVLGAAKEDGNTHQMVKNFINQNQAVLFNISDYQIGFFDYENRNSEDDFVSLIQELIQFDQIVMASPVYWYCMSAQLKVFIDRLSDLLIFHQCIGRKLKGKDLSVIATGSDKQCPDCFVKPFELTAKYLGMNFKGIEYLSCS